MKMELDGVGVVSLVRKVKVESKLVWGRYETWKGGELPPEPDFKFSVVSEGEVREAVRYWLERGQVYKDGDFAYTVMVTDLSVE